MYRQRAFKFGWRTLIFALVIHNFYQLTLSASSRCKNRKIAVSVVERQNVSIDTFYLGRPLLIKNQSLVWRQKMEAWNLTCTHNLLCSRFNRERYKLIEGTHNKTMKILIEHAKKSDEGIHIISVYNGSRRACVFLRLNLTVTDSSSFTKFLRNKSQTSKISCKFVQNTEGERGKDLLTEKAKNEPNHASNRTFANDVCNSANNFTAYLDFREIVLVTQNSTSDCRDNKRNEIENKTKSCVFDSLGEPIFINDRAKIVFERCNGNGEARQKWWYVHNGGHEFLPLPEKYQFDDNYANFFCESQPSSTEHNTVRLGLREHKNTCTSVFEVLVYSTTFSNCTKLILNVSIVTASPSTTTLILSSSTITCEFTNRTMSTGRCKPSTSISGESAEKEIKTKVILICVASMSTIALVFSIASCFFKCKFISGGGNLANHPLNSQAARHGEGTVPVQTIPFITPQNTSQLGSKETWIQRDSPNQASVIDKGEHDHGQERGPSSSECQRETLELHSRSVMVEHHTLPDTLKDLGKPSTSTDGDKCDESQIGTSYPSCLDSNKDISGNRVHLPSTPPPLPSSPSSSNRRETRRGRNDSFDAKMSTSSSNERGTQSEGNNSLGAKMPSSSSNERETRREGNNPLDVKEVPSCLVKPKMRGEGSSASGVLVRSDVDALYAKPDMSRKTKKSISRSVPLKPGRSEMSILDLDYDNARNPMDIESAIANTIRKSEHIYESCD